MSLPLGISLIVVALLGGVALGFFIARQYMMKYLKDNPPINEDMLRMMMMQMGQKPSQKKINQMMTQMNRASDDQGKKPKKAKKTKK
ncbi:YneF family protein [Sporosarcina sp. CAU 1771]